MFKPYFKQRPGNAHHDRMQTLVPPLYFRAIPTEVLPMGQGPHPDSTAERAHYLLPGVLPQVRPRMTLQMVSSAMFLYSCYRASL